MPAIEKLWWKTINSFDARNWTTVHEWRWRKYNLKPKKILKKEQLKEHILKQNCTDIISDCKKQS